MRDLRRDPAIVRREVGSEAVDLAVIAGHTKYDARAFELRTAGAGTDVEGDPVGNHYEAPPCWPAASRTRRRVLLIGARVALLARLAAALRTGVGADITSAADDVPADELRGYGAVVFGRSAGPAERDAVRAAFAAAGVDVPCVDGRAPIVPLLVARTEQALDRSPPEQRRLTALASSPSAEAAEGADAEVEVTSSCRVQLTAYRIDRLARTHTHEVFDGVLEPGRHRIPLDPRTVRGSPTWWPAPPGRS
ncbi:hypothetical protein SHIRM173S_12401 [Streptomyces hirsutus]